jgi:hypothetical protein
MTEASLSTWMNVAEAAAYLRVSQPYLNKLRV